MSTSSEPIVVPGVGPVLALALGSEDSFAIVPGEGKAWGKFVAPNLDGTTSRRHPWKCAKNCGHRYTQTGANATRVGKHITGAGKGVQSCSRATSDDQALFPQFLPKPGVQLPQALPPSQMSSARHAGVRAETSTTSNTALEIQAAQEQEGVERQAFLATSSIPGLLQHMMRASDRDELHQLWAEAFHHAGIPPNAIEDDYVRHAIFKTSKIEVCILA